MDRIRPQLSGTPALFRRIPRPVGSGTDTLVFKYAVQEDVTDGDGITVANGWRRHGLQLDEGESIVATDNDAEASRYYKGIHDPLGGPQGGREQVLLAGLRERQDQRERQPRFTSSDTLSVAEDSSLSHTLVAVDDTASDVVSGYAIWGGEDETSFEPNLDPISCEHGQPRL